MFKLILAGLLLAVEARAVKMDLGDSPYKVIVERNAFDLKPAPPPPPPETPPAPPPSNLKITGISTITSPPQLMLVITEPGGKQVNEILREGERKGAIEVVAINAAEGTAKVRNAGTETVLSFKENGIKVAPGPAPVATPFASPFVRPVGSAVPLPPGMGNNPAFTPATVPNGIGGSAAPTGFTDSAAGGLTIPTRSVRTPPVTPQATAGQLSPEEQALMIELNRHLQDTGQSRPVNSQGRPIPMPPLPPTPLTPQ